MRNLKDWVGKRVKFRGTLDRFEGSRILLLDVRAALYSSAENEVRKIDHVWCLSNSEEIAAIQRCTELDISSVGDVVEYTRADYSRDYAFKRVAMMNTVEELKSLQGKRLDEQLITLHNLLMALKQRRCFLLVDQKAADMKKLLENLLQSVQTSIRLRDKAIANQRRGIIRPDPVRFMSTTIQPKNGFALPNGKAKF